MKVIVIRGISRIRNKSLGVKTLQRLHFKRTILLAVYVKESEP